MATETIITEHKCFYIHSELNVGKLTWITSKVGERKVKESEKMKTYERAWILEMNVKRCVF